MKNASSLKRIEQHAGNLPIDNYKKAGLHNPPNPVLLN